LNPAKVALARVFEATRLNDALLAAQRMPCIRAVNYHDVPDHLAPAFERQLELFARRFVSVGHDDLLALHAGRWPHARPGVLLSFDDGLPSHARVVAPLLERHGLVGWFFVPAGSVGEGGLSWPELRRLAERHFIGCHSMTHRRLSASLDEGELRREIVDAKRVLEEGLGREIQSFCWVGGEEWSYSAGAARVIRAAGYQLGFMTNNALIRPGCDLLQLQRTNVEASYPMDLFKFQLSGLLDLLYLPKRRRVNRLTRA
jgi:peptidoglycan/xylan/chitin deacetylase (PgdA/CDA1 family)